MHIHFCQHLLLSKNKSNCLYNFWESKLYFSRYHHFINCANSSFPSLVLMKFFQEFWEIFISLASFSVYWFSPFLIHSVFLTFFDSKPSSLLLKNATSLFLAIICSKKSWKFSHKHCKKCQILKVVIKSYFLMKILGSLWVNSFFQCGKKISKYDNPVLDARFPNVKVLITIVR